MLAGMREKLIRRVASSWRLPAHHVAAEALFCWPASVLQAASARPRGLLDLPERWVKQ